MTAKAATKLLTEYDATRSEALFASAVLLVEGKADLVAARTVAGKLGFDLDARNLSILECGGKTSIQFHARLCRSLGIPVCALYDDDLWPTPEDADEEAQAQFEKDRQRAVRDNADIEMALPDAAMRFVAHPSLEAKLGIGRHAENKPMKAAAVVRAAKTRRDLPKALIDALICLNGLGDVSANVSSTDCSESSHISLNPAPPREAGIQASSSGQPHAGGRTSRPRGGWTAA